ncbi:multidrug effflux MFS transporter [Ignatzschineria rhizosphaerae]|uniref:Multidrug effflux MFS transporter n=1 Tax=Ignatzschineria rhizosphaerae TaxID=2923279 RepID=A0ABY3WZV5_9GAMM|nr:multidrug effflux MFS transporter [Ignatzschineria rhizosphaerae]UNM95570.1 multidrug effflux MFS transporter [Ignatzschineria rhizosphaerae]
MNNNIKATFTQQLPLLLLIMLVMFPQIVETIYSPALPLIAEGFTVSQSIAAQTLSVYFIAFAFGVTVWGLLSDRIGRRKTTMIALTLYIFATIFALLSPNFTLLLSARILMAFAAAIGSIGTQTIIRDQFSGDRLRYIFSLIGIALAISPILGLILGVLMVQLGGYHAVFSLLTAIGTVLLIWSLIKLPETMPENHIIHPFWQTLKAMMQDRMIWQYASLIAAFNIMLFSYYQLAPFIFETLQLDNRLYGFSGILLGSGTFLGAFLNNRLINRYQLSGEKLISLATTLALISAILLLMLESSWLFMLPMTGIMLAYSMAIPNILSLVLKNYQHTLGTAGAILGFIYYCLIGLGLIFVGMMTSLGIALLIFAGIAMMIQLLPIKQNP